MVLTKSDDMLVFLLPTLNEEKTIAKVIDEINELGLPNYTILVVDGRSKDKTREIAKKKGASVIIQKAKGKGSAIIEAVATLKDSDTVVMTDADATYSLKQVPKMIKLADNNTMVFGSRVFQPGSITSLNRFGNFAINSAGSLLFLHKIGDMCTGLRVFKASSFKKLKLKTTNFEIETEWTLKALKKGVKIVELPIEYSERKGETKLSPLADGYKIISRIFKERFS